MPPVNSSLRRKPYPAYRPSGTIWLGDLPQHWSITRLKYCLRELIAGGTPDSQNPLYWAIDDDQGIPWVAIADMTKNPIVTSTEKRISIEGLAEKQLRILPAETLLYSMYASLGKVAILRVPAATNQAILGLIPDERAAVQGFLRWWLEFMEQHVTQLSSSNTQDNLNAGKVRNMPIMLPPLDEQHAIVTFLDRETTKIDALITKKERLIEVLEEKRTALISTSVTRGLSSNVSLNNSRVEWLGDVPSHWTVARLKQVCCESALYGANESAESYADDGVRFLRTTDIDDNGGLRTEGAVYLDRALVGEYILKNGDLLISRSGTLGRSFIYNAQRHGECAYAGYLVRFVLDRDMEPRFAFYFTKSRHFADWLSISVIQSTIGNVNGQKYANMPLPVPPLDEQRGIVAYLDRETSRLGELIGKVREHIGALREHRTALISAAVTGKIDVREALR